MLNQLIHGNNQASIINDSIFKIHTGGPVDPFVFESLAYIKAYHPSVFSVYEGRLLYVMGLFYKTGEPNSLLEEAYQIFADAIEQDTGKRFTPLQASAFKGILGNKYFSFSAPTSAGKSFLFRELILKTQGDIVIVVPSRALIAEYYEEVVSLVDRSVLVLQFVEDVNRSKAMRRVFIVTPERGSELFKYESNFNISLILLDEAHISEEEVRGMTFDSFVRRADRHFPLAKKVFAHPFISNPQAQLTKHGFLEDSDSHNYNLFTVGKIFVSAKPDGFEYFSPNIECSNVPITDDLPFVVLSSGGTMLVYISKAKIYGGEFVESFGRYIDVCPDVVSKKALDLIDELKVFIGAGGDNSDKHSTLIDMMKKGIVIHHGSMPLKARLIIERFIKSGFARICFATSTLSQGINMPFDLVWVDNFSNMTPMVLKNLIGRSGRTTNVKGYFDFGYTIINKKNINTFKERYRELVVLSPDSSLDDPVDNVHEDLRDLVEAVKEETFDLDLHLTDSQVERLKKADVDKDILLVLDGLFHDGFLITAEQYYDLGETRRRNIKVALKNIYVQHLRRKTLTTAEVSVLSAAIPILLWYVQGKSFSEIVSLRYSFLSKRDDRRKIYRRHKIGEIDSSQMKRELGELIIRYSPIPSSLPNAALRSQGLYPKSASVTEIDFDLVVYDTYDYLDKVVGLSLADPLCAAFSIYFNTHADQRAKALSNYIRYGTNDVVDIWLLKYGFGFEDIEWIRGYVVSVDEMAIVFREDIKDVSEKNYELVARYL